MELCVCVCVRSQVEKSQRTKLYLDEGINKTMTPGCPPHLIDEVPDVPRVGDHRSNGVLGLRDDGALIHPPYPRGLTDDVLQGVRLLQLAQVIVLPRDTHR